MTLTGISSDGLITYEIEVTVINNPLTNSILFIAVGIIIILILGTTLYLVYEKKKCANND